MERYRYIHNLNVEARVQRERERERIWGTVQIVVENGKEKRTGGCHGALRVRLNQLIKTVFIRINYIHTPP